jgi:hypothetical protein
MFINRNFEKKANAILYLATHTRYCTKTKLIHMLYLLDFEHFRQTGRSVTEESYCALPSGPVPADFYRELNCPPGTTNPIESIIKFDARKDGAIVVPTKAFDDIDLTRRQVRILADLAERFCDDTGEILAGVVRAPNGPWSKVYLDGRGQCGNIPYALVLDDDPERDALLNISYVG